MKRLLVRKRVWVPLMILIGGALVGRYLALKAVVEPEELKAMVERTLSEQFSGLAHVERVKIGLFSGVELEKLSVNKPHSSSTSPFITIESLRLKNYITPMLKRKFVIREIDVERPVVFLIRDPAGKWNLEQPAGGEGGGGIAAEPSELASLVVHDATVQLRDELGGRRLPDLQMSGVNLTALIREAGSPMFDITGRISNSIAGPCTLRGLLDQENGTFSLTVSRRGLVLDEELAKRLRAASPQVFGQLSSWRGRMDVRLEFLYDLIRTSTVKCEATARMFGCGVAVKDVPYALENIFGSVTFSSKRVSFQNVRGRSGPIRFSVDGNLAAADPFAGSRAQLSVIGLPLDKRLPALASKMGAPESVSVLWRELNPTGKVDLRWEVSVLGYSGGGLRHRGSIFLRDCGLSHAKLGAPVVHVNGQMDITGDRLIVSTASGEWRGAQVEVANAAFRLSPETPVDMVLALRNLQLSEEVKTLLPKESQDSWDLFNPQGTVNAQVRLQRDSGADKPIRATTALTCVKDCEFTYKYFPRRITHLRGVIEFGGEGVGFRGVTGEVGRGKIAFADILIPFDPEAAFNFEFNASGVEFDQEMVQALSPELKEVRELVEASGCFDLEWHQQRKRGKEGRTIYDIVVRPKGARIVYKDLPYALNNVTGAVIYDGSKVVLDHLVGWNDKARFSIDGQIPRSPRGGIFNIKVAGRNVPLDEHVRAALPQKYQAFWDKVTPKGQIQFAFLLNDGIDELGERLFRYEAPEVRLMDCEMNPGLEVTGIRGALKFQGEIRNDPKDSWASGEVNLDRVTLERLTYRKVDATFHNEWDKFWCPHIEAQCYGGKVVAEELVVTKGQGLEDVGYDASFSAENVSAEKLCKLAGLGLKNIQGTIYAKLRAEAPSLKAQDLYAYGSLRITDGHLGDLPALLGIEDKLRAASDQPAFTDADFEYLVMENEAIIKKATLLGPVFNLKGGGKITLNGDLALEFHPEPSEQKPGLPIVSQVVDGMFGAAVTVSVTGTVWNPVFKLDPLIPISKLMQGLSGAFRSAKKKQGEE